MGGKFPFILRVFFSFTINRKVEAEAQDACVILLFGGIETSERKKKKQGLRRVCGFKMNRNNVIQRAIVHMHGICRLSELNNGVGMLMV